MTMNSATARKTKKIQSFFTMLPPSAAQTNRKRAREEEKQNKATSPCKMAKHTHTHESAPTASASASASAAVSTSRTATGDDFARNDQYPMGKKNNTPRNARIFMKESTHTYVVDGCSKFWTSCTTLLHNYFSEFNALEKSEEIAARTGWKKKEYRGKSGKQIRDDWTKNGDEQSALGTALHAQLERYFNEMPITDEIQKTVEWAQFKDFEKRELGTREWVMFHPEWMIFSEKYKICGSMDAPMVMRNNKNQVIIGDWKRTKEIEKNGYGGAKGFGPCRDIDSGKIGKYGVQLNVYRDILQKEYGVEVVAMYLAVFHPEHETKTALTDDDGEPYKYRVGTDGEPCRYRFIMIEPNQPMVDEIMEAREQKVEEMFAEDLREKQAVEDALLSAERILVCGDRLYTDQEAVEAELRLIKNPQAVLIHGGAAKGADALAAETATSKLGWSEDRIQAFPANWKAYGKGAGPLRDLQMLEQGKPQLVLAFHNKLWDSTGTKDLVALAREAGIPVRVIGNE